MSGHRIEVEFEPGFPPQLKLICPPEGGCPGPSLCMDCGRHVDDEDDIERCDVCPTKADEAECVLRPWFENDDPAEWFQGTVAVPVEVTWETGESPTLTIVEAKS